MESYVERTKRSLGLYERAKRVLPAGVTYMIRHLEPYPFYVTRASGSRVYDVDQNEYIDYWMGHGALVLGHRHPAVMEAVRRQLDLGFHFGLCHEWEVRLAERVVRMVPSAQMVRFTNSGTEANMYAVRLARAYTKRVKIGKFEGGWHGGYDALHKGVKCPLEQPDSAGLAEGALRDTVVLPFNDLDGVTRAVKGLELACIIVEPVQGAGGFLPAEGAFLTGLRELCDETGALLVFDEVITGFRLAPGGAQELYGVLPDITVLGKALGGGELPIGAFCSSAEIMELVDHLKHPDKSEMSFHGGTYSGNPLVMRAGCAALKEYERGHVYRHIDELGERARRALEDIIEDTGADAHVTGVGSMLAIHFTKEKPKDVRSANKPKDVEATRRYRDYLVANGIAVMSYAFPHFFISLPHSGEDIDKLLSVTERFLRATGACSG